MPLDLEPLLRLLVNAEGTRLKRKQRFSSFKEEGSLRTKGSLGPSTHLESVKISGLLPLLLTQIVSLLVKPVFYALFGRSSSQK